MKYKAVIFDLDGTLLNTIEDISDSCNAILKKNYSIEFSIEEYKYMVGKGIDEFISTVLDKAGIDLSQFEKVKTGYIEEYAKKQSVKTKIYNGVMELLINLKKLGISVNILSNKPHFQTEEVVGYYFKDFKFNYIYGKKPEFKIKPYPESALDLMKRLNVKTSEILYVGDTNTDIQTAINAKLVSVGVLWGFRKRQELLDAGANYLVSEPEQILKIILGDDNDYKQR